MSILMFGDRAEQAGHANEEDEKTPSTQPAETRPQGVGDEEGVDFLER